MSKDNIDKLDEQVLKLFNEAIDTCITEDANRLCVA